ncbi:hypothetical protein XENOCAPTIV_007578 [Xenoophorus captivus]|uniref:Secreted protein n=1 Tax=Xenoophorus captivus TaxID=1517983 RepID=A0ABV0QHW7_9TELE
MSSVASSMESLMLVWLDRACGIGLCSLSALCGPLHILSSSEGSAVCLALTCQSEPLLCSEFCHLAFQYVRLPHSGYCLPWRFLLLSFPVVLCFLFEILSAPPGSTPGRPLLLLSWC